MFVSVFDLTLVVAFPQRVHWMFVYVFDLTLEVAFHQRVQLMSFFFLFGLHAFYVPFCFFLEVKKWITRFLVKHSVCL